MFRKSPMRRRPILQRQARSAPQALRRRLTELEAENTRLRQRLDGDTEAGRARARYRAIAPE